MTEHSLFASRIMPPKGDSYLDTLGDVLQKTWISADWLETMKMCGLEQFGKICGDSANWKLKLEYILNESVDQLFNILSGDNLSKSLQILAYYGYALPGTEKFLDYERYVNWNIDHNNPEYLGYLFDKQLKDNRITIMEIFTFSKLVKLGDISVVRKYLDSLQLSSFRSRYVAELIAQKVDMKFVDFMRSISSEYYISGAALLTRLYGNSTELDSNEQSFLLWISEHPLDKKILEQFNEDVEIYHIIAYYYGLIDELKITDLVATTAISFFQFYDEAINLLESELHGGKIPYSSIFSGLANDTELFKRIIRIQNPDETPIRFEKVSVDYHDLKIMSPLLKEIVIGLNKTADFILTTNWTIHFDKLTEPLYQFLIQAFSDLVLDLHPTHSVSKNVYTYTFSSRQYFGKWNMTDDLTNPSYTAALFYKKSFPEDAIIEVYVDKKKLFAFKLKDIFKSKQEVIKNGKWKLTLELSSTSKVKKYSIRNLYLKYKP